MSHSHFASTDLDATCALCVVAQAFAPLELEVAVGPKVAQRRALRALADASAQAPRSRSVAADAYAEKAELAGQLLVAIGLELEAHAARAAADPRNWGYAGDAGHVAEQLGFILSSLAGLED